MGKGENARKSVTSTSGGFAWLMLNSGLPQPLAAWLRQEIQHINQQYLRREDVDTRTEILPGIATPAFPDACEVTLPATLSLVCYDTPGLSDLASMLQTRLKSAAATSLSAGRS